MILKTLLWIFALLIILIFSFLIFWKFWFLRNPKRKIPENEHIIISPADGKIIEILDTDKLNNKNLKINKGLLGKIQTSYLEVSKSCYIISIFMSVLNVHIQRASLSGKVIDISPKNGRFFAANSYTACLENEKTEILIKNKKINNFKIIQIAGFLARRIETWIKPKQELKKGEIIGRINFGSQVTIILPKNKVKLIIKKGNKILAGESIIAEITK